MNTQFLFPGINNIKMPCIYLHKNLDLSIFSYETKLKCLGEGSKQVQQESRKFKTCVFNCKFV